MRHARASVTAFVLSVIVASCATASSGSRAGRRGGDLITGAELEEGSGEDLLALILRVRPAWLQVRSRINASEPEVTPIVVVIDGVPQPPGMEPLHGFRVSDTQEVRRLSASDATTRFGTNMTAGAILIVTKHSEIAATGPIRETEVRDLEPGPGDHVRLGADTTLTGVVRWRTADSISVQADGTGELQTFGLTSLQRLDVSRGRVPQAGRVLLGAAIGGVVGYLVGSADDHYGDPSPPRETFCRQAGGGASCASWRKPGAVLEFTLGGVAVGGLSAALFAQAERWKPVTLQPALVSADWDQRGRFQVRVSVPTR
jgi:hypothetical protein